MSKDNKRRDSKGRILRTGEQQRSNGQYLYTYKGKDKKNHFVYSWKLEPTDKQPEGKRSGKSLGNWKKRLKNPSMKNWHTMVEIYYRAGTGWEIHCNKNRGKA